MKNQLFKSTWGAFMNNWAFFRRSGRYKVRNYSGGRLEKSIFTLPPIARDSTVGYAIQYVISGFRRALPVF